MAKSTPFVATLVLMLAATPVLAAPRAQDGAQSVPNPAGGHSRTAFIGGHDLDRDGRVSRAEYDTIRQQRFQSGDKDGNDSLNEAEYVAEYEGRLRTQYGERPADDAFAASLRQAVVRFYSIDRDRDGLISIEENRVVAQRTWDGQDTDGDGVVTTADPIPVRRSETGS